MIFNVPCLKLFHFFNPFSTFVNIINVDSFKLSRKVIIITKLPFFRLVRQICEATTAW